VQGKVISYYSERQGVSIKSWLSEEMVTSSSLLLRHAVHLGSQIKKEHLRQRILRDHVHRKDSKMSPSYND
jgi:hypothetical protein